MRRDPRVAVITAAMCQGNKLEPIRDEFPERFFDVGICESHAVAFAAGLAKAGLRPIVDIYSTFLQRSYDQIFQEVALQNLPVTLHARPRGPGRSRRPDAPRRVRPGYMRLFPNMVVMAPGDALDLAAMLDFALRHDGPTAIRYPKATAETRRPRAGADRAGHGRSRSSRGATATIVACGTLLPACVEAADAAAGRGARRRRDQRPIRQAARHRDDPARRFAQCPFVVTVEEGALMGGFGSAVLEAASDAGLDTSRVRRLGIPDRFIEHGERGELLADLGLDAAGIARACRQMAARLTPIDARVR